MRLLALLLTAALAALVAGPAGAADPTPTYSGCGKAVKDASGDATEQAGTAPDQVDLTGAFVNADQNTVNLIVKNLDGTVPPPYSSITYDATYGSADASLFVRAFLDFTGSVVFEYGHLDSSTPLKRYQRDGDTKGNLFKGANGVVQITVPPEAGGKPGTQLKGIIAETQT